MGTLAADLKYSLRMLMKHPGLASISIIALALGLGLTTTMWSITWGALLRGLPYQDSGSLMYLARSRPTKGIDEYGLPASDLAAWREQQKSFEDLVAYSEGTVNLSGTEGRPERYEGGFITAPTIGLLRVTPAMGRGFTEADMPKGAPPVMLLGWDLWQSRYGGDAAIVGKTVRTNGVLRQVVGVMPRGFYFPERAQLWLPLTIDPLAKPWGEGETWQITGRLRPGVSRNQSRRELETIAARLAKEHPKENEGVIPIVKSWNEAYVGPQPTVMLWTMMVAVLGVLLIACSNVANLLLARAITRSREVALRTALGASRRRIVSQLITESFMLAVLGGVLGVGIAWVGTTWFANVLRTSDAPFWINVRLDPAVLLFCAGVTLLASLVSGVLPALQASRTSVNDVLKDEGRGTSSLRLGKFSRGLVMAELALSGGLLVAAGFMIQSVVQLSKFDYGVPTQNIFTARVGLFESTYPDSASRRRFWTELEQRLAQIPGQGGAALMTTLPGLGAWNRPLTLEGKTYATERDYPNTRHVAVSPEWFAAFGLRPLEGRVLGAGDITGALPVAVLTRNSARTNFGAESPIGKRVRLGGLDSKEPWLTIVGVVPDVWYDGTDTDHHINAVVITPLAQGDYNFVSIAVTGRPNPLSLTQPVRGVVEGIDKDQPIYFVRTLAETISQNGWFYGAFGTLFMVFGGAALFLATIGVYGVMSFSVSRRTQEVGVRMALGANSRDVMGMFLKQGGRQVVVGLSIGLVLAFFLSRGLALVMFNVNVKSPVMYAVVTLALAATSLLAIAIPARRAMSVHPMEALHYQ